MRDIVCLRVRILLATEAVEEALQEYQRDIAEINRKTGVDASAATSYDSFALNASSHTLLRTPYLALQIVTSALCVNSQFHRQIQSAGGALGGLASAIDMIPRLQEKKKRIDIHTNMATAILNHVKVRSQSASKRI